MSYLDILEIFIKLQSIFHFFFHSYISQESEEIASSPDLATAVVGSPDDPARRTQAWLKESVEDTYSDSENETEESLLSEVSVNCVSGFRCYTCVQCTQYYMCML